MNRKGLELTAQDIEAYRLGATSVELADHLSTTKDRVLRALRRAGVPIRRRGVSRPVSDARRAQCLSLRAEGRSYGEIGALLGVTRQAAHQLTKSARRWAESPFAGQREKALDGLGGNA